MLKAIIPLLLLLSLSACVTPAKYSPARYSGDNEIYPAVIGAFNDIRAKIEIIDIVKNNYVSGFVYDDAGNYKYKVAINFKHGLLQIKLTEIHKKDFISGKWKIDNYAAFSFNDNNFLNKLSNTIIRILNNQTIYETIKSTIHQNIGFHYMVMKHMDSNNVKRWITKKMEGQIYNIRLTNEETVFLTNSSNKTDKKFIAHLTYSTRRNSPNELPFDAEFDLDLHTNNENYKMLKSGDILNTSAKIVDASVHVYITTFGLSLDEQQ